MSADELRDILGDKLAETFMSVFGGEFEYIPMADAFKYETQMKEGQRKVAEMHRAGATVDEMCAAVGKSRRTIFRWLNLPRTKIYGDKNGRND